MAVFSWRSTLSASSLPTSRTDVQTLEADLAFTLLTLAFAYSNLAFTTLVAIGSYEYERTILDSERQAKDEKLNFAANLLAKASGIYEHVAHNVLPTWEKAVGAIKAIKPPELRTVVVTALARCVGVEAALPAVSDLLPPEWLYQMPISWP